MEKMGLRLIQKAQGRLRKSPQPGRTLAKSRLRKLEPQRKGAQKHLADSRNQKAKGSLRGVRIKRISSYGSLCYKKSGFQPQVNRVCVKQRITLTKRNKQFELFLSAANRQFAYGISYDFSIDY